jgi:hypothetical protein
VISRSFTLSPKKESGEKSARLRKRRPLQQQKQRTKKVKTRTLKGQGCGTRQNPRTPAEACATKPDVDNRSLVAGEEAA